MGHLSSLEGTVGDQSSLAPQQDRGNSVVGLDHHAWHCPTQPHSISTAMLVKGFPVVQGSLCGSPSASLAVLV